MEILLDSQITLTCNIHMLDLHSHLVFKYEISNPIHKSIWICIPWA